MLLILAALKEEIRPILDGLEIEERVNYRPALIFRGEYLGHEVIIAHTGIGAEKMQRAAAFCIGEYKPSACINIGYCGALTPHLSLGDIVIADNIVHETNGAAIATTFTIDVSSQNFKIHRGTILTVDKVIQTPHEKAFLGTKFGAIALDMESAGMAKAASKGGIPFTCTRSVLDTMDMHLLKYENLISDDGATSIPNVVANIIRRPQNITRLPHLHYCASKARETLIGFINEIVKNK